MSLSSLNSWQSHVVKPGTIIDVAKDVMVQIFDYVLDPKTISLVCKAWNRMQDNPHSYRQILNWYRKQPLLSRFIITLPEEVPLEKCKTVVQNIYISVMQLAKEREQLWWIPLDYKWGKLPMDLTPMMKRIQRLEMYTPKHLAPNAKPESQGQISPPVRTPVAISLERTFDLSVIKPQHSPQHLSSTSRISNALTSLKKTFFG